MTPEERVRALARIIWDHIIRDCQMIAEFSGDEDFSVEAAVLGHANFEWLTQQLTDLGAECEKAGREAAANTTTLAPRDSEENSEAGRVKLSGVQDHADKAQVVGGGFVPTFKGDLTLGELINGEEQLPRGTDEEEAILRGALAVSTRYEHECDLCKMADSRDIKRAALMALRYQFAAGEKAGMEKAAQVLQEIGAFLQSLDLETDYYLNGKKFPHVKEAARKCSEEIDKILKWDGRQFVIRTKPQSVEKAPEAR